MNTGSTRKIPFNLPMSGCHLITSAKSLLPWKVTGIRPLFPPVVSWIQPAGTPTGHGRAGGEGVPPARPGLGVVAILCGHSSWVCPSASKLWTQTNSSLHSGGAEVAPGWLARKSVLLPPGSESYQGHYRDRSPLGLLY